MSPLTARLAALSLGTALAGAGSAVAAMFLPPNPLRAAVWLAWNGVFPDAETRVREEVPPRDEALRAELARLGEHPWAGVYRGPGSSPDELSIAPGAGFTLYHGSWCGTCAGWRAAGKVLSAMGPRLELQIELDWPDDRASERFHLDPTLHLVRWGDLLFAVPAWRMETFCAEASDGYTFPEVPFRYLGSRSDFDRQRPSRPSEQPRVPSEFRPLLLDAPVTCLVAALIEWRRRPELDHDERRAHDVLYSIDAGSDDGLAVGIHMFVEVEPERTFRGRVEQVEGGTSRLEVRSFEDERDWAKDLVGKRASMLHPRAAAR